MAVTVGSRLEHEGLSRRSFIKTALGAGAASLGIAASLTEAAEISQQSHPVSAGQNGDLTKLSLVEAAELVRKKKVSPVELTKACLARIERLNPSLNAFITVTADSALAEARAAETDVQHGKWRGQLHGIPIALKDLFDTAGVRTTAGSALFKDRVPKEDAEVVRRLKAAGAVLVGKTNMHEFAYGGSSIVTAFGAVHNPWELGHIAGGSSGGSASGLAAELFYGALGSDTGGSVRNPAAFCSVVGLKPTYGLVSTRGVIPLSWSLDHVGPMARTVADTAALLQAIAGYDPAETTSERMNVPDYSAALRMKTSGLRLGIAREFFFAGLDPEIEAAMNQALAVLEKLTAGHKDVAVSASGQERLRAAVRAAEAWVYHAEYVTKTPELYQPETLFRIRLGADIKTGDYIQARRELAQTRREIGRAFENVDVLITPTTPVNPPTIVEMSVDVASSIEIGNRGIRNTSPFDVYGIPTISVPCGFTRTGLPIALQISGPLDGDAVVLQLAHAYEQATEWHKRRPSLSA
jgi:aspartyl-tRNA(Asn)/glutamyl-tRNA(Gln) amidotransferase subunit A